MDPATAFSLAGTVLQFVEIGYKFTSLFWRLHRTQSDELGEQSHLQKITNDLNAILPDLEPEGGVVASDKEQSLGRLAQECSTTAAKLAVTLSKIKPTNTSRKRDALKVAIRIMWKESEINALQNKLSSYRDQLNFHLLVSIREFVSESVKDQKSTLQALGIVHDEALRVGGLTTRILDYLVPQRSSPDDQVKAVQNLQQQLALTIYAKEAGPGSQALNDIQLSKAERERACTIFLQNLEYGTMVDRQNRIAIAHETTFHWVFDDEKGLDDGPQRARQSNLQAWLESDDQLFWITGKAGSGKSTLMKHLSSTTAHRSGDQVTNPSLNNSNPTRSGAAATQSLRNEDTHEQRSDAATTKESRCHPYLGRWAGSSDLILASFFFWNSGEEIQTTQDGLFRTLLHQIFSARPDLIPMVAPKDWESACLFDCCQSPRTLQELDDQLIKLIEILKNEVKICFFIDGLDEFGDDHEDLISMVKRIIGGNNHVKVCVASRPWTIFQTAFDQEPSLRLEDLTYNDVLNFIRSQLHADAEFDNARLRYPSFADQLIEKIVSKAAGVFLWVDLVVKSLLAGMRLGDRIQDLQRRLDGLPDDLEKLYDKILHNLDPFYLDHAAQYFALVEQAEEPLTLLQFSFADEETAESAIDSSPYPLTDEQISLRSEAMSKRLNNRCKGLLEVDRGWQDPTSKTSKRHELTVQYLHRTDPDFDAAAQLCVAYFVDIKKSKHWQPAASSHQVSLPGPSWMERAWPAATSTCNDTQTTCSCTFQSPESRLDPSSQGKVVDQGMYEPLLPLCKYATRLFRQAAVCHPANQKTIAKLIFDLHQVLKRPEYNKALSQNFKDYFQRVTRAHPWEHALRSGAQSPLVFSFVLADDGMNLPRSFDVLTVALGITEYVKIAAPRHGLSSRYEKDPTAYSLLEVAMSAPVPDPEMVQCLLSLGADPNFQCPRNRRTPWLFALSNVSWALQALTISDSEEFLNAENRWKESLKLLYKHGGYLARVSNTMLTPVSRRILREVQREVDPTLPGWQSKIWPWSRGV